MSDSKQGSLDKQDEILLELRKIRKILTLANAHAVEVELNKYAKSLERKKIWANIDGKRIPSEIAKDIGVSVRAVEIFVKSLTQVGLVEPRAFGQPPKRSIDFVPASWLEALESKTADTPIQTPLPVQDSNDEVKTDG